MRRTLVINSTWDSLVQRFPKNYYHPMIDPIYSPYPWVFHSNVSEYAVDSWLTGDPPLTDGIFFWENESVERYLPLFRESPRTLISVYTRQGDQIMVINGDICSMVQQFPLLFNSRQLQRLRVAVGLKLGSISLTNYSMEQADRCVYIEFSLPRVSHAKVFRGDPSSVKFEAVISGVRWRFSSKSTGELLEVDLGVIATYLDLQRTAPESKDYLSTLYYLDNFSSYTSWTYETHLAQLEQVLSRLKASRVICAPGDGCGIVVDAWKRLHPNESLVVVSGDLMTNKEHFWQTMTRAPADSVLVLSYVWSLMNQQEREMVQQWKGPVIFVEPRDQPAFPGLTHYGPGLHGRSIPAGEEPILRTAESLVSYESVLFSENLLRLPEISFFKRNIAVQYYQVMRPLAPVSPTAPIVVADLVELFSDDRPSPLFLWRLNPDRVKIYLACIGALLQEIVQIDSFAPGVVLQSRTVYMMPSPSKTQLAFITRHFFTSRMAPNQGGSIFFCCPNSFKERIDSGTSSFWVEVVERSVSDVASPFIRVVCAYQKRVAIQIRGRLQWYNYTPWLYWNLIVYHQIFFPEHQGWQGRVSPYSVVPLNWSDWLNTVLLSPAQHRFIKSWLLEKMVPDRELLPMYWLRKADSSDFALVPYTMSIRRSEVDLSKDFSAVDTLMLIIKNEVQHYFSFSRQGSSLSLELGNARVQLDLAKSTSVYDDIMSSCPDLQSLRRFFPEGIKTQFVRDMLSIDSIPDCLDDAMDEPKALG